VVQGGEGGWDAARLKGREPTLLQRGACLEGRGSGHGHGGEVWLSGAADGEGARR
jgi:hypothetical protein